MTLLLKDGNVYYLLNMLSDTAMCSMCERDYALESNVPIWKIENHENAICGTSPYTEFTFVRYDDSIFDCYINMKDLTNISYPRIKEKLASLDLLEDGMPRTSYIVAQNDKAYRIDFEGGAMELGDYFAIGNYSTVALYVAELTKGMPIEKRIRKIVEYVSAALHVKAFPLAVMNTRDCKLEIWEK